MFHEVFQSSPLPSHVVNAMLADPDVKAKLLAVGKKLLATPTESDKANAIAA